MSRVQRFASIIILWVIAGMSHLFATMLFAPGTPLYEFAGDGVGTIVREGFRQDFYTAMVFHIPIILVAFSLLWAFASEYQYQKITTRR